jgi:competence protein ComEC
VPRSGWLAVGAIAAAWAIPIVGLSVGVAGVVLGAACLLVAWWWSARMATRAGTVVLIGSGVLLLRLAVGAPTGTLGDQVPDGRGPWTFVVEAVGAARAGQQTATLRTDHGAAKTFRVAATLPAYPEVIPGDRVTMEGPIRPRPDSPYGDYLERIGAIGTLTARSMAVARPPAAASHAIEAARQAATSALAAVLPEPEAGLAAGILVGLRDRVDRDLAAAFTTAGVSHVVAISGWNIAIVAAAIAATAGGMQRRRRSILTMVAIVAYVAFAGASASVVRAGAMAGVVLLARESGRAGRAAAALAWAAVILLVADPGLIRDAGFQLSALATAGLIAWATPLTGWIDRVGRGHVPGWLAESLGVSLAAQAATLPIVLASFGRLAILSPLVNLAVVPLVAPAMAAGLVAMLGGFLVLAGAPPLVGSVLAAPGWVSLRIMVAIVDAMASLPFASVTLPEPIAAITAVATLVVLALVHVHWQGRRSRPAAAAAPPSPEPTPRAARPASPPSRLPRLAALTLAITVVVTGAVLVSRPTGVARVSVLDVGQGDAILVEGSRGGRLLIDGGPDPGRLLVVLDQRIPPWDRRIDAVILTHPHEDHVAGLARLLDRYQVRRVFEPGMRGPGPGYAAWLSRLASTGSPMRLGLAAGDRLAVDEIDIRVLWPIRGGVPVKPPDGGTGINNVSIVVLGAVGDYRFLLAGDVEEAIDPSLLGEHLPRLDLLKVAHHGSRTATTQAFVDAVRPGIAIASAGTGNPYGHPARATLDRLSDAGARVFRTDRDGTVAVTFAATGPTVRAEGGRAVPAGSGRSAAASGRSAALAFLCGIPAAGLVPDSRPPEPIAPVAVRPGGTPSVGYHPPDDDPGARGRRLPPAVPGSPGLVHAARARGRRGRRVPRGEDRGPGDHGRSARGRGRGAPPRHRQDRAGGRSRPRPPPWRWLGRLADQARPP